MPRQQTEEVTSPGPRSMGIMLNTMTSWAVSRRCSYRLKGTWWLAAADGCSTPPAMAGFCAR